MTGFWKKSLFLAVCLFFISGCSTLAKLDKMAGSLLASLDQPISSSTLATAKSELEDQQAEADKFDYQELTRLQKKAIDEWLSENGFNRYGDKNGTRYEGGTPLVDEENEESINRFEYILERVPDIIDKISE